MAEATEFDAIVVGSGMSGGMSAKELCERGLRVLVLERGPEIVPERDYSDQLAPWETPNFDNVSQDEIKQHYFRQYPGVPYALKESNKDFWVKDDEHPYEEAEGTRYEWLRGYHTAGPFVHVEPPDLSAGPHDSRQRREGVAFGLSVRYENRALV